MSPPGRSWHLPYVAKYRDLDPDHHLHVIFLQRLSEEERDQVVKTLEAVDHDEASRFDVPASIPRKLVPRPWIRDYWPSSKAILEIGAHAKAKERRVGNREYFSYRSIIFVDSGWEAGNVIAAHWEGPDQAQKFHAVRVPMNIANLLLTACDANEGYTLSRAVGNEIYEEAKVDFYEELPIKQSEPLIGRAFSWPESLPQNLKLPKDRLYVISLREISQSQEDSLRSTIAGNEKAARLRSHCFEIYRCKETGSSRRDILNIYKRIYNNSPESDHNMAVFFVDDVLEAADHEPQLLAAFGNEAEPVSITPFPTGNLMELWKAFAAGRHSTHIHGEDLLDTYGNLFRKENIHDLDSVVDFSDEGFGSDACPVFFLQPFTPDEERRIRAALGDSMVEHCNWSHFGYLWPSDTTKHSVHDLKALFESCDPFSPSYHPRSPGPYHFAGYPSHFVAVDERCLEPEGPEVWQASSLDFSGEDVTDELGWFYGLTPADMAHGNHIQFDVANAGPDECIGDTKKLWLSDLTEYKNNEWRADEDNAGDFDDEEEDQDTGVS